MTERADTVVHAPIQVTWVGTSEFDAGRAAGPVVRVDGDAGTGPSPFDLLLAAIGSCAATDVVEILKKQRTPVQGLRVTIEAERVAATPRRLASAVLHFAIRAPGATAKKAERAVELSVTRYCSVRSSLIADAPVTWTTELES
jgi:putative redox protein